MNVKKIYQLSREMIVQPYSGWEIVASENLQRKNVVYGFLLPFSLLVGVCSVFGILLSEEVEDYLTISYLLMNGAISFMIIFLEAYLSSWLITEIAYSLDSGINSDLIFNLVIFSHIPFFLTLTVSRLFPQLIFLNVLGAYSFILFSAGMEHFTDLKDEKKSVFLVLSILIMLLLYFLLTIIFNSIYDVVLNQFTTFND